MVHCKLCGTQNSPTFQTCQNCGEDLLTQFANTKKSQALGKWLVYPMFVILATAIPSANLQRQPYNNRAIYHAKWNFS